MHELHLVDDDRNRRKDTLLLVGGVALIAAGAGLILSNRTVRKYIGQAGVRDLLQATFPDVERYLRLRAM